MPVHYEIYGDSALYHCLRNLKKEVELHEIKIKNPKTYIKNWNDRNDYYKEGIIKYWQREIENMRFQIKCVEEEIKRRGI